MNIFISYRRAEAGGHAGRISDHLRTEFGADSVFHDVTGISVGREFKKVIEAKLKGASVMLVVVHRDWAHCKDTSGELRLAQANDFVRLEVGTALRQDIPVVPVLVGGAALPSEAELPDDLKPLVSRQYWNLRDDRWDDDCGALVLELRKLQPPAPAAEPASRSKQFAWLGACAALVLVATGLYAFANARKSESVNARCDVPALGLPLFELTPHLVEDWHPISKGVDSRAVVSKAAEGCNGGEAIEIAIPEATKENGAGAFIDLKGLARRWSRHRELHARVYIPGESATFGNLELYALSKGWECYCAWWMRAQDVPTNRWADLGFDLSKCEGDGKCKFDFESVDEIGVKLHHTNDASRVRLADFWVQ
jgi:TIR domain